MSNKKLCYVAYFHCVKPLCFYLDWMWQSIYFKLNNTIILYKHKVVFDIPQGMSTFVDFTKYFTCVPSTRYTMPVASMAGFIKSDSAYFNTG